MELWVDHILVVPLWVQKGSGLILWGDEHAGGINRSHATMLATTAGLTATATTALLHHLWEFHKGLVQIREAGMGMHIGGNGRFKSGGVISTGTTTHHAIAAAATTCATSSMVWLGHSGEVFSLGQRRLGRQRSRASSTGFTIGTPAHQTTATTTALDGLWCSYIRCSRHDSFYSGTVNYADTPGLVMNFFFTLPEMM